MYQEENLPRGIYYEKEEFTKEEYDYFRKEFLENVAMLVDYCSTNGNMSVRERLELLAFCILSSIDGESGNIAGFSLIPILGEDRGLKYTLPENVYKLDIAGALHDNIHRYYDNGEFNNESK